MKALVVIDMQNDFITGALANAETQKIVKPIAELVRTFDGKIVATRDTHAENYMETNEGKHLPVPHCLKGSWGWQIVGEIAEAVEYRHGTVIDKPVFGYIGNEWQLDDCDEINVVGTCTDICVIVNALVLKTLYPETPIKVISSLVTGITPENHVAALQVMKSCQIDIA